MNKKIALAFASAILILAACNKENGNSISGLNVTGSIQGTESSKVSLSYDGTNLNQAWEVGDHIVGSYVNGSMEIIDVDYKVKTVKNDGSAVFEKVGEFDDPTEGTKVCVLCLGEHGDDYIKTNNGETYTLGFQDYNTVMTAEATVDSGNLHFEFVNKVAKVRIPKIYAHNYTADFLTINMSLVSASDVISSFKFNQGDIIMKSNTDCIDFCAEGQPEVFRIDPARNIYTSYLEDIYFTIPPVAGGTDLNLTLIGTGEIKTFNETRKNIFDENVTAGQFVNLGSVDIVSRNPPE